MVRVRSDGTVKSASQDGSFGTFGLASVILSYGAMVFEGGVMEALIQHPPASRAERRSIFTLLSLLTLGLVTGVLLLADGFGRWFGDAGIDSPNRGTLGVDPALPAPGMGGLNNGAGEAISARSGGSTVRFGCATLGDCYEAQGCLEGRTNTCLLGQPVACAQ